MQTIPSIAKISLFIVLIFASFSGFSQIDIQTNFDPAISEPIDERFSIPTLADTSTIAFVYPGLTTWVVDIEEEWQYTDSWNVKLSGVVTEVTAGTGISIDNTDPAVPVITNIAPDQTVSITGAGSVAVTGTYPNFTATGSGITGSGTTNRIPKFTATGVIGNSIISENGVTAWLGALEANTIFSVVGDQAAFGSVLNVENTNTTSAGKNIAIFKGNYGSTTPANNTNFGIIQGSNLVNNYAGFVFYNSSRRATSYVMGRITDHSTSGQGGLAFGTYGAINATRLYISPDGNIGVGNNILSPSYLLDLGGTSAAARFTPHDVALTGTEGLFFAHNTSNHFKGHDGTSLYRFAKYSDVAATNGQIPVYDDVTDRWVPTTLTGLGGIFGGSGTVPDNTLATLTGSINFQYNKPSTSRSTFIRIEDALELAEMTAGQPGGVGQTAYVKTFINQSAVTKADVDIKAGNLRIELDGDDNEMRLSGNTSFNGVSTVNANIEFNNDLLDVNNEAGTAGQVLSSLGAGNGVDWVTPPSSLFTSQTNYQVDVTEYEAGQSIRQLYGGESEAAVGVTQDGSDGAIVEASVYNSTTGASSVLTLSEGEASIEGSIARVKGSNVVMNSNLGDITQIAIGLGLKQTGLVIDDTSAIRVIATTAPNFAGIQYSSSAVRDKFTDLSLTDKGYVDNQTFAEFYGGYFGTGADTIAPIKSIFIQANVGIGLTYDLTIDDASVPVGACIDIINSGAGTIVLRRVSGNFITTTGSPSSVSFLNTTGRFVFSGTNWYRIL